VFDENAVTIKEKLLFQKEKGTTRGQINFTDKVKGFNNAVISLFNTAKADTFVHEFSHLNFQDMLSMAKDNEQIKADVRTAVEFYNQHAKPSERIKDVDKAVERLMAIDAENHLRDDEYVKVHEAFANGFSEYLKDPNTTNIPQALKEVYEALKQFLGNLAQTIAGTKITITPEMDAVYRRLFEPEFVNNIYETKENYDAEIEAKEFKESPIKDITDKDINDAFNNLDNLFSEEKKSYTPNEIFNAKIAQLKEEGKTDGTIVVEQLKALVDNSTASAENKAKLKEYIDLNADKYIAEAGEMERMRKGVRDILTDNVLDLETKEKLVADKTLATYIKTSFTQLGKTVDEVIGSMSYNDVVANEALILEQIAQNVPSQDIEYANLDFLSKKLKKGYAYLDMMKAEKGADKAKIKQLEDVLYKQLSEALQGGTLAAKRLAAQQMFDVLRPNIMTDAIDRMVREEMNGEKLAEAKELIRVLQERVKKGLENEDVFKGIIEELEMNFGDEKKRNELLAKRNLEMDKELSEIEGRIAKNDKEESETSLPAKVRNVQNRAGNKLKNDAKTYSNARKEILAKIEVLNGLFSGEERSPKELVADYIFNYVAEQQALGGKVIRFNHMVQHFKDLGLDITNEGLAETYEQARQLAIAEGVSRKAMDTPQQVADALQNIEDKAQKAKLKAEKQANQNKTKADNNLDKMLAEALKGGKWDERVTSVDREKSIQEVMDKVKENNPTITPEEEAKIRERLTTLFNEKTDKWTEKELEKIQKKLNPKEKKQISGNFKKLANIINTGVFNKTDVSDLLLSELGLNGLTDIDKNIIEHSISVIQQLLHGDLKNKEIERLSAYITAVTNPTNFITSLAQSKLYMEMLNSVVTSAVNATTLIGSLEKAISKSIMQLDPKYLQIYLQGFNKGMVKSAVEKGYFKTNENYELAQTETGFAPVRMGEYAKYGELLKTKGALGKGQRGYAAWVNFTNKLGSKRLARVNEGVDNLNTLINSNMAAYEYNKKLLKKENPNISKQELNDKIAKKLMPISYEEAEAMAIEQLALVGRQRDAIAKEDRTSPSEIRRVAYDIINNSRDEATKVLMEQEGQRASFRNRLQPFSNGGGFIEGLSAAVQGLFNTAAASVKNNPNMTNKDKAKRIAGIKFAKSILTPFIQTPANLLEAGTHYAVVGGLIKEVSLGLKKRSLKNKQSQDATNRKLGYESSMAKAETQAEKDAITNRYKANEAKTRAIENTDIYAIDQYQKDVAVRMVKGVTMLFLMDMFFKSLQDDDDKEVKSGVYGDDPKNGKYRNTIVINGTRTPIMLTGILAPLMSLYAAKSDYERYINEKKVKEEITDEDEAFQNKMAGTANRFIKGVLKTTPYYGSARVFESIQNTLNEKDDKVSEGLAGIGRIVGNAVGYGLMPIPRPFNDYSAFFYTDTKKPTSFTEGFMAVYNPLNPYITGKVDIDPITGKPVDVRDNRLVSVSGMVKNYLGEGADEVASQLKNHNIGIVPIKKSDFIKDGADMTDNEFYLLQNDIYKEFSTQLKASIDERIKQAKSIADIKISVLPNIKEKDAVTLKRLEADKLLNKEVQEMYKNSIDIVLISKSNILRNNTENREYLFNKKNLKNN
jgi:hemoglobin-like flavoprotein